MLALGHPGLKSWIRLSPPVQLCISENEVHLTKNLPKSFGRPFIPETWLPQSPFLRLLAVLWAEGQIRFSLI